MRNFGSMLPSTALRSGSGASNLICSHEINLLKRSLPESVEGGSSIPIVFCKI